MRSYGKVKVRRTKPQMAEVPDDCGYMQKFEYNIDLIEPVPEDIEEDGCLH